MTQTIDIGSSCCDPSVLADLPTLPAVGLEILHLSRDPDASIGDLARVIQRDPTLSVRVIGMVNSPNYLRREPVATVSDAALVLGRQAISIVALTFSLAQGLPRTGQPAGLDLELFWRRSLTTATVARHVARTTCASQAEEAFLAGLLCHLGKMVLAHKIGDVYGHLVEIGGGWPSLELEERELGWTSMDVTLAVLREWNMAEAIIEAIEYGVDPMRGDSTEHSDLASILALAVAADCSLFDLHDTEGHRLVDERFRAMFGDHDSVLSGLDDALAEASEMLEIPLPKDLHAEDLLIQARERMLAATLSVASENTYQARRLEDLQRENHELNERATIDALTGLQNRRSFDETLAREASRRQRGQVPDCLGVIMVDIDNFKRLNDAYGHSFGDQVLKAVAEALQSVVRSGESLHRYGGEEFVLLAPACNPTTLAVVAHRVRTTVQDLDLRYGTQRVPVTLSAGAACARSIETTKEAQLLVDKADALLYEAKRNGRNRVEASASERL